MRQFWGRALQNEQLQRKRPFDHSRKLKNRPFPCPYKVLEGQNNNNNDNNYYNNNNVTPSSYGGECRRDALPFLRNLEPLVQAASTTQVPHRQSPWGTDPRQPKRGTELMWNWDLKNVQRGGGENPQSLFWPPLPHRPPPLIPSFPTLHLSLSSFLGTLTPLQGVQEPKSCE